MTNPKDKASAEWDTMTHEQKIAWLATEWMGWEIEDTGVPAYPSSDHHCESCCCRKETWKRWWRRMRQPRGKGDMVMGDVWSEFTNRGWNPFTDGNHCRQVEEKVLQDESLFRRYANRLSVIVPDDTPLMFGFETHLRCIMKADTNTKYKALFLAHHD